MAKFIKVIILATYDDPKDDTKEITVDEPALINLDEVESFRKTEEGIYIYYKGKSKEGKNNVDLLKDTAGSIAAALDKEGVYVKEF
jgi:hypothetical protein